MGDWVSMIDDVKTVTDHHCRLSTWWPIQPYLAALHLAPYDSNPRLPSLKGNTLPDDVEISTNQHPLPCDEFNYTSQHVTRQKLVSRDPNPQPSTPEDHTLPGHEIMRVLLGGLLLLWCQFIDASPTELCTKVTCSTMSHDVNSPEEGLPETRIPCHFHPNHTETCFHLLHINTTWENATRNCENKGGQLIVVTEEWQHIFLQDLLRRLRLESVWIGARVQQENWTWDDGSSLANGANWRFNQPSTRSGNEFCVIAVPYWYYAWAAKPCSADYEFICELPLTQEKCMQNDTNAFVASRCFSARRERTRWEKAKHICHALGGHLAVVNDTLVTMALRRIPHIVNTWYSNGLWIGLSKSRWYWVNGEEVSVSYWEPSQPSHNDTQCVRMQKYSQREFYWENWNCDENLPAICQINTSNVLKTSTAAMDQTTISYSTNGPDAVPMETPDADELRVSQTLTKREVAGISSGVLAGMAMMTAIVAALFYWIRNKRVRSAVPLLDETIISAYEPTAEGSESNPLKNASKLSEQYIQGKDPIGTRDKPSTSSELMIDPEIETTLKRTIDSQSNQPEGSRKSLFGFIKNWGWSKSRQSSTGSSEDGIEQSKTLSTGPQGFRQCYFREAPPSMVVGEGPSASHHIEALVGVSKNEEEISELP